MHDMFILTRTVILSLLYIYIWVMILLQVPAYHRRKMIQQLEEVGHDSRQIDSSGLAIVPMELMDTKELSEQWEVVQSHVEKTNSRRSERQMNQVRQKLLHV